MIAEEYAVSAIFIATIVDLQSIVIDAIPQSSMPVVRITVE